MGQNYSEEKEPMPGDIIEFCRPLYGHYGIAVDHEYVIHLTSADPEPSASNFSSNNSPKAVVKKERICNIAGKNNYRVNNKFDYKSNPRSPREIVRHAETLVGKKIDYDLLKNNCEHFATFLRYGVPDSQQAKDGVVISATTGTILGLGVIAGLVALIFKGLDRTETENED